MHCIWWGVGVRWKGRDGVTQETCGSGAGTLGEKLGEKLWMPAGLTRDASSESCRCLRRKRERKKGRWGNKSQHAPILEISCIYLKIGMQRWFCKKTKKNFQESFVILPLNWEAVFVSLRNLTSCVLFNNPAAQILSYLRSMSQQCPQSFPSWPANTARPTHRKGWTEEMGAEELKMSRFCSLCIFCADFK